MSVLQDYTMSHKRIQRGNRMCLTQKKKTSCRKYICVTKIVQYCTTLIFSLDLFIAI
jgi:hypothetical protein